MAGIRDYSSSPALNTSIRGVSIAEGMERSDVNNALRAQMSDLKDFADEFALTYVDAKVRAFPTSVLRLETTGRNTSGDGGGAIYKRWAAPQAELLVSQQNYSWFESTVDGSRWQLDANQQHFAAMFGAVGDNVDRVIELNKALAAPMVKTLYLGDLTHKISKAVRPTNGQVILGNYNMKSSVLSFIPLLVGAQGAEDGGPSACISVNGTLAAKITSGGVYGVVCEVNRSGLGTGVGNNGLGVPYESLNRVSGIRRGGYVSGHRVQFCITRNVTGYSFYTASTGNERAFGNETFDCKAINGQTAFECTGKDIQERYVRCVADSNPDDGGSVVIQDYQFHFYNGTKKIELIDCSAMGPAPAMLVAVTDPNANIGITAVNCNFSTASVSPCVFIANEGATPSLRNKVRFVGGSITNTIASALSVSNSDAILDGTICTGEVVGITTGIGGIITMTGNAKVIGRVDNVANTGQPASAISVGGAAGAAIIKHGPISLEAYHAFGGARSTNEFQLTIPDDLVLIPAVVSNIGTAAPRVRQRKKGFKVLGGNGATDIISAGNAGGVFNYWADIVLDMTPTDVNKLKYGLYFSIPDLESNAYPVPATIQPYRRPLTAANNIFVTIASFGALPANTRLFYDITEEF